MFVTTLLILLFILTLIYAFIVFFFVVFYFFSPLSYSPSLSLFLFSYCIRYNILYPASHAHTLLLDLEQLVVVANLDKINIDSPTCSVIVASSSTSLSSLSTISKTTTTTLLPANALTPTTKTSAYTHSSALQSLSYGDGDDGDGLLYSNAASMINFYNSSSLLSKTNFNNFSLSTITTTTTTTPITIATTNHNNELGLFDQYLDNSKLAVM